MQLGNLPQGKQATPDLFNVYNVKKKATPS